MRREPARRRRDACSHRLSGPTKVEWHGVIAKCLEVWIESGDMVCVVESALPLRDMPTQHDRTHASVISFVMQQQSWLKSYKCRFAILRDEHGYSARIPVNMKHANRILTEIGRAKPNSGVCRTPLPSPLCGFLSKQRRYRL